MRVNVRVPEHQLKAMLETILRIFGFAAQDIQATPIGKFTDVSGCREWLVTFWLDRDHLGDR